MEFHFDQKNTRLCDTRAVCTRLMSRPDRYWRFPCADRREWAVGTKKFDFTVTRGHVLWKSPECRARLCYRVEGGERGGGVGDVIRKR